MSLHYVTENVSTTSRAKRKRNTAPDTEEEVTDGAATDGNGWIECRNRKSHHINRYGNPMGMIGSTFTVYPKYKNRFPYNVTKGKVAGVVKKADVQGDYFKFYDAYEYVEAPPLAGSEAWCFMPCKSLMSLDPKISYIKWDATSRHSKKRSKVVSQLR